MSAKSWEPISLLTRTARSSSDLQRREASRNAVEIGQRGALLFRDEYVISFKITERKRVTRRLFGKAGFVQVILTSAGNLAPPIILLIWFGDA